MQQRVHSTQNAYKDVTGLPLGSPVFLILAFFKYLILYFWYKDMV